MPKILVIHNPVSGKTRRLGARAIRDLLEKKQITYDWFETEPLPRQHFETIPFKSYDRVLIAGGDGTIREVAQFFIEHNLKIPLGIVAQGSANVLATTLGIPFFPLARAVEFALKKDPKPLDVIAVNRQYYALIAAGQGYDTLFIRGATRGLKRQYGFFAYLISFIRTYFTYINHRYKVVVDGERIDMRGKTALVFNCLSLAGLPIDTTISPIDGELNLVVISPKSIWDLLGMGFWLLFHRSFRRVPRIQILTGKKISINQHKGKYIQIDGEIFKGKNLQLEVLPGALSLIYDKKF